MASSSPSDSPFTIRQGSASSSLRASQRQYSRRSTRKRVPEADPLSSGTEGSGDDATLQPGSLTDNRKRVRLNSGSPSSRARRHHTVQDVQEKTSGSPGKRHAREENQVSVSSVLARTMCMDSRNPSKIQKDVAQSQRIISGPSTPRKAPNSARPLTPHSSPRDLSALFSTGSQSIAEMQEHTEREPGVQASPTPKRAGGLRRMLTKAQSLGDIPDSPSTPRKRAAASNNHFSPFLSTPDRTPTRTQSSPVSPFDTSPLTGSNHGELPGAVPRHNRGDESGGRAQRTYGRTRTHADEDDTDSPAKIDTQSPQIKESYAELRKKFEVDNSSFTGGAGNLMQDLLQAPAPIPVSDMRSKGETRRFMDELAYLAEGIADRATSTSLKCNSSIDILRNMQDEKWVARMHMCGQTDKIWLVFYQGRADGDQIMESICLLFLTILDQSGSGLEALVQSHPEQVLEVILSQLRSRGGPLEKGSGAALKIRRIASTLSLSANTTSASSRRLASLLLGRTLRGFAGNQGALRDSIPFHVTKSITMEIQQVSDRFHLYDKGLDLYRSEDDFDIENLRTCLSFLLTYTTEASDVVDYAELDVGLATTLCRGILTCSAMVHSETKEIANAASGCIIDSLHLLAYFTTASRAWSEAAPITDEDVKALAWVMLRSDAITHGPSGNDRDSSGPTDDLLCLALAVFTSNVLGSDQALPAVARTIISATCIVSHGCIVKCRCDNATSLVTHFIDMYKRYTGPKDEPDALIISGYLALVLARLFTTNETVRETHVDLLHGNNGKTKLQRLLRSLGDLERVNIMARSKLGAMMGSSTRCAEVEDRQELQDIMDDVGKLIAEM